LTESDPKKRLGQENGISDVKLHSYFKPIKWKTIEKQEGKVIAPIKSYKKKLGLNLVGEKINFKVIKSMLNEVK